MDRHLGKSEISITSLQVQSSFQSGNVDFGLLIILLDENRRISQHRKQWLMSLGTGDAQENSVHRLQSDATMARLLLWLHVI